MATIEKKTSRIDLRLTDEQKQQIEQAAHLKGTTLSQWIVTNLLDDARRTIMEQSLYRMSETAFDEFARSLEAPTDSTFAALMQEKTIWEN